MNALELANSIATKNPDARFAIAKDGSAVGVWIESRNQFVEVYVKTIVSSCPWVCLIENGQIKTTLCNGKEMYPADAWNQLS